MLKLSFVAVFWFYDGWWAVSLFGGPLGIPQNAGPIIGWVIAAVATWLTAGRPWLRRPDLAPAAPVVGTPKGVAG